MAVYGIIFHRAGAIALYSVVNNFLELLGSSEDQIVDFSVDDTRTAIAVLYYKVVIVDGRVRTSEMDHFRKVLSDTLDVREDELLLFEDKILEHVRSERSLQPFTSIIKRLPTAKRAEILRHMEQISISDKELHEFEINLVARTAELINMEENWRGAISMSDKT